MVMRNIFVAKLMANWSGHRGELGFGYDPVFQPDGHSRTFGEMSADEKHSLKDGDGLSHRAKAFAKFAAACLNNQPA